MRLISPWTPRLAEAAGPPYERLVTALADDIAEGGIPCGARLPPHRELAYQLGIGLGTVTKAYAVLERRGLVQSVRGRGMFVSGLSPRPHGSIDLSLNTPPQMLSDRLLAATLAGMAKRLDADTFGTYAPAAGRPHHRAQMARWLAGQRLEVTPDRILLCNGAQHALSVAFAVACRPGGVLLTEAVTYPGAIMLARQSGLTLVGLDMDDEGLTPEALERALCSPASAAAPRVLYVTPTLQNPTAATMSSARRRDIVRLCRAHDVTIVEDDVYSVFAGPDLLPLAALAPERTLYVGGLSKTVSPGLRIGSLVVPSSVIERAMPKLQATCTMASPLTCMIMEQWLTDGTATSVAASIRLDAAKRYDLVRTALPFNLPTRAVTGFHVWLPMSAAEAEHLSRRMAAMSVIVMPPNASLVDPGAPQGGIRLSVGGPTIDALKQALTAIGSLFDQDGPRTYFDQPAL